MRRISLVILVAAAIAASYGLGRRSSQPAGPAAGRRVLYYVDPMHPAYRSDKPGTAPDCGMRLEPVFADAAPPASTPASGAVAIDGPTRQLMGIRLAAVERRSAARDVRAVGRVVPEDTRVFRVNSGVDGFIRETFQDATGAQVKKDQRLATYYAPDFIAAVSGFLAASERVPGAASKEGARSIQNYTDRLRNLGMSETQIKRMAESRQLPESIDVISPSNGFILARNITAGQHFMRDVEFYRIADLSRVWVVAEIPEHESHFLRPGGRAQVTLRDTGRRLSGVIADSLPQSDAAGGTVKVRVEFDNSDFYLWPDMLVDVEMPIHMPAAVTVPVDALVDSGARARVYVERAGLFEPREVETGWRSAEWVEIRKGLNPGERVVASATYLVDSESRLKDTPSAVAPADVPATGPDRPVSSKSVKDPRCGMTVDSVRAAAQGNILSYKGATYYFCSNKCKQEYQNDLSGAGAARQGDDN
jgi:Cu(I)/Ag(I) efflux system membrane fusion protein